MRKKVNEGTVSLKKESGISAFFKEMKINRFLYLMAVPGLLYYIIFCYAPMYNLIIAFKDYSPFLGTWGSPWVGFEHFERFFNSIYFTRVIKNTLGLSVYSLAVFFWIPIIFALLLNELRCKTYKKLVQTFTYIPHFISTVVLCGIITGFCRQNGLLNDIIAFFGGERSNLLMRPELFKTIYVLSDVWVGTGWASIVYVAALTGIDPALYEAAEIDGAGRFRKWISITIPGVTPTIVTMLLLNIGTLMSVGFEKVFLLYNPVTYETGEVISTYVYQKGMVEMNFSFSTAVNLFNSVANLLLVLVSNYITRKVTDVGLW